MTNVLHSDETQIITLRSLRRNTLYVLGIRSCSESEKNDETEKIWTIYVHSTCYMHNACFAVHVLNRCKHHLPVTFYKPRRERGIGQIIRYVQI